MEGIEMEEVSLCEENEDLYYDLLSRLKNSQNTDHQHLCAVIGAMAQELQDQNIPRNPTAYFAATISSLDKLSIDPMVGSNDPVSASLLIFLEMILPRVSSAILRSKGVASMETIRKVVGKPGVSVGAMNAGLKCISHLIVVGDKFQWQIIVPYYGFLLSHIIDRVQKVRKRARTCLQEVLHGFQGSSLLVPASEAITSLFERYLLLAGASNPAVQSVTDGPTEGGAMEVLYILEALKYCLPLTSTKCTSQILKYLKPLFDIGQPIVTRHLMDILRTLCSSPTSSLAPDALLVLICLLASSVSADEKSADEMTATSHLLLIGMEKVYALDRDLCVVKLPAIFSALAEILACEHEEAVFGATKALKSLISTCIDESLIKQATDQIKPTLSGGLRRSGPTILEKVCATVESLLGYQYNAVWDMAFQVVSAMFDKLGESSSFLMRESIKSLADIQQLDDEYMAFRKQLQKCVGSAIAAMGPQNFLSHLPLNLDVEDLSLANVWLIPILKQHIVGARLSFFTSHILGLVTSLKQRAKVFENEGRIVASRTAEALVYRLWSLLPAYCNYPVDTADSFKGLAKSLNDALYKESELHGIICSGLQILIQQNKRVLAETRDLSADGNPQDVSISIQKARACYTPLVAENNLRALSSFSQHFFSVLFGIFVKCSTDSGGSLQSTIAEFASISDKMVVRQFFTMTMQRLLKLTQEAVQLEQPSESNSMQIDGSRNGDALASERGHLLDLAISLLPGLDAEGINLLFISIKPAMEKEEGLVQKKAYKVLSIILKEHGEFLQTKLDDICKLLVEVMPMCHFSAKRHRLDCLYYFILNVSKDTPEQRRDINSAFLTEIILALKEANKKTRNRAYDLLVKIGHTYGDVDQGGSDENLHQLFNTIIGFVAGESPHMKSAGVKGLARLAYEFSDLVASASHLLPSVFILLRQKNREINKANLGLMKVLVAKLQADRLHTHLKSMVENLLQWQDDTKNHFKAKVKHLLEMLVRKCGLDAVKAVMPEEHMKLLTNIRKIKERKDRKIAAKSEGTKSVYSRASTARLSRWSHTNIFSDVGDEDGGDSDDSLGAGTSTRRSKDASVSFSRSSLVTSKKRTRETNKQLPGDLLDHGESEPLDLLDRRKTRSALRASQPHQLRPQEIDENIEIAPDGRLIITTIKESKRNKQRDSDSDDENNKSLTLKSKNSSSSRGTPSIGFRQNKRQKTSDSGRAYKGDEYASKKASGDLKKKGKLEPYAYWPLDRKMLNTREEKRAVARKGLANVMRLSKKLEGRSVSSALSVRGVGGLKRKQKAHKGKGRFKKK
ncbi:RRP12-like protein [Amborella trichopoda]|nr:RRP12-like protein [Amborella trichopoda]|eukprot:XP_006843867.2 RRP12-like protein [Amborella trichopoda]